MGVTTLKTAEAAAVLQMSPNTLRSMEKRLGFPKPERTPGRDGGPGHRRYRRAQVLALRDASREGLTGRALAERAQELEESGRYAEPPAVRVRMERLEREVRACRDLLEHIARRLDNAGIVPRDG